MGINYDEINANLLRVIQNADNAQDFLAKFFAAAAQDVRWTSSGPNGVTVSRVVPNITKYMHSVKSTIVSTMKRVVYIDENAGDDANDGTKSAPVASLRAAAAFVPYGGMLIVRAMSDITLRASKKLYLNNLQCEFSDADVDADHKIIFDLDNGTSSALSLANTVMTTGSGYTIETRNSNGGDLCPAISANRSSYIGIGGSKLIVGDNTYLLQSRAADFLITFFQGDNIVGTNAHLVSVLYGGGVYAGFGSATINGNAIDDATFAALIKGVITDANGSVQNINSNKKLA